MKKVRVYKDQNLVDLCIQETGSLEGLIDMCRLNNLSLDDDLSDGDELMIDESKIRNRSVVVSYANRGYVVNTGQPEDTPGDGIGAMEIEDDFIIT